MIWGFSDRNDKRGRGNRRVAATGPAGDIRRLMARQALPLGLSLVLLAVVWEQAAGLDLATIRAEIGRVTPAQWLLAAVFSGLSFWAVGRYDSVVHRLMGTGIGPGAATAAGATAIAIAQTVGFGVVSGALVRWRMLPGLSLVQALRLSLFVAASFMAGWAVVSALMVLIVAPTLPFAVPPALAIAVLAAAGALVVAAVLRPRLLTRLHLPPLAAQAQIVGLVLVDTLTAGAALYVLLPDSAPVALPVFLSAYLIALGAGLLLATPGGVGAFEVILLSLLPQEAPEAVLAAVVAFRVVYYALPALIGAVALILGPRKGAAICALPAPELAPARPSPELERVIAAAPDAEAALLRQNRLSLLPGPLGHGHAAMVAPTGQSLVLLRGGLNPALPAPHVLRVLERTARARFLTPCLYKAPARLTVAARRAGWQVVPVARDAWLDPARFDTSGPAHRQLRRKLRKAEKAGIEVTPATGPLPLRQMAEISATWAQARGGERGFSMGVFDPASLAHSRVWLIWHQGRLTGFLSLMDNGREQVLDLMRYRPDTPDGSMHLALTRALLAAAEQGYRRLSLAAVPVPVTEGERGWLARLRAHLDRASGAAGLRQFKTSFAPRWQTLYMAAPSRLGLALAGFEIAREITTPPGRDAPAAHLDHAAFEFAPGPDPWQDAPEPIVLQQGR